MFRAILFNLDTIMNSSAADSETSSFFIGANSMLFIENWP